MGVGVDDELVELAGTVVAWLQTPGWAVSEVFLVEHPELLSDAVEALLCQLDTTAGGDVVAAHLELVRIAHRDGVSAAYQHLR